jgi:hypothetical protein
MTIAGFSGDANDDSVKKQSIKGLNNLGQKYHDHGNRDDHFSHSSP